MVPALATASWRAPWRGADDAGDAIPHDARAQLGELLGGVAPVEHVEHVLEQLAGELGVGVRAGDERVADRRRDATRRAGARDCDDLLSEHVEGVAGHDGGLDQAFVHAPATTAHSSRSPRNLGKMRPRLTSSTPWPARPMRCSPRATDLGDSI